MKFLHLADLHLDSPMRGLVAYAGADQQASSCTREAFMRAVDFALAQGVDLVVIAGDVYDGDWQDFSTGVFFAGQLTRLCQAAIPVVLIHGNHDSVSQISRRLTLPEGTHVLRHERPETVTFEAIGTAVHGQSFAQRAVSENLAANYPAAVAGYVNIGLLHSSIAGHAGHDTYAPCTLADLQAPGYDYWALGHIHRREQVSADPPAHYSGVIQGRSVRETGPHGGLLVICEPGSPAEVELVDFDVLRWEIADADCTGVGSWEDLLPRVRASLEVALATADGRPVAARVRLHGVTRMQPQLLAEPERLQAELQTLAEGLAPGMLWLGKISVEVVAPAGSRSIDAELAAVLEAVQTEAATFAEFERTRAELAARVAQVLPPDSEVMLSLVAGEELDAKLIVAGIARLQVELGLDGEVPDAGPDPPSAQRSGVAPQSGATGRLP